MSAGDAWSKLRKAYDANQGVFLNAEDVTYMVLMDTSVSDLIHADRGDGVGLPISPAKPKGHLYYVDAGQWFVCRALNARKARMVGVAEFGRGNVRTVRRATPAEVKEFLRWQGHPDDHQLELEEPTS